MTSTEHLVRKHYPPLPNGWKIRKLKFIAQTRTSNVDKIISDTETPVSLCNYIDIYYNDTITPDLTFMQGSATEAEIERFELRRDQVIVTKDSESWDDIAIPSYVPEDMPGVVCGYHLAVLTPDREHLSGRYLSWLCRTESLNGQFKVSANGVTRYGLGHHAIKNALVSFPPVADQERIADFLDERTARIDGLIARKERLLELLAEQRQALITRAVTKGLAPDAEKRDCRVVEGVGLVNNIVRIVRDRLPDGWKIRKLKFIAQTRTSNVDKIISDTETPVSLCNYIDIYYNDTITPDLTFMQGSATEAEIERFELRRDQVIVTKDSESWDDIAIPSYVPEDMPGVVCGYHLAVLTPDREHLSGRYLSWLCRTESLNGQFKVSANGVTRYGLGHHAIKNALVSFPPIADQERIADFLDERTARIDEVIVKNECFLELLAEQRQALITAAVTGQLDVTEDAA